MNIKHTTSTLAMLALTLACIKTVKADEFDPDKHIGGDWGGTRSTLAEDGFQFKLGHFSQTAHNISGGESKKTAYADQFFLGGYFDLEKLLGWRGAEFKVEITNRNGDLINNKAGIPTLLQSQQIYGRGDVTRLTQFSLTQRLFDDHLVVKAGRIYPDADFYAISCNFQHLTFCSGGTSNSISQNWYGSPLSSWGGVVSFTPDKHWFFKIGGYDTNPQTLSHNQGLKLGTSGHDSGTLMIGEVEFKPDYGNGIDGDYKVGITRNSNNLPRLVNQAGFPRGYTSDAEIIQNTDHAFYANFEQQVIRTGDHGGLRLFASLIRADDKVSTVSEVASIGGFWTGIFAARPNDRLGLAFGRNAVSNKVRAAQRRYDNEVLQGPNPFGIRHYEYPIELNYNFALYRGIDVMPSIQYISKPGGLDVNHATILGLQVSLDF